MLNNNIDNSISLQLAKDFLRVDHNDDDLLINNIVRTATDKIESYTGKALKKREICHRTSFNSVIVPPLLPINDIITISAIHKKDQMKRILLPHYYDYNEESIKLYSFLEDEDIEIRYIAGMTDQIIGNNLIIESSSQEQKKDNQTDHSLIENKKYKSHNLNKISNFIKDICHGVSEVMMLVQDILGLVFAIYENKIFDYKQLLSNRKYRL